MTFGAGFLATALAGAFFSAFTALAAGFAAFMEAFFGAAAFLAGAFLAGFLDAITGSDESVCLVLGENRGGACYSSPRDLAREIF